jgi:hypothetical protein
MNPSMEIPNVVLEIQSVLTPRHAIHPRRGPRLQRLIDRPQAIDINVMQKRGEPHIPLLPRHPAHATKLT